MRPRLALLLVVLAACTTDRSPPPPPALDAAPPPRLSERRAVFAPSEPKLRGWEPSPTEAAVASSGVEDIVRRVRPDIAADFASYYAQIYGVADGGRRRVQLRFFCARFIERELQDEHPLAGVWKSDALVVHDGGPCFFAIDYDPRTKEYGALQVNGDA